MHERRSDAEVPDGLVIAIDGPSGSGKSTVARAVAQALGYRYLDTGAMYRALTWLALERGVDLADAAAVAGLVHDARIDLGTQPDRQVVCADGTDVTTAIRGAAVTGAVSAVSALPEVRAEMLRRQRAVIGAGGVVVEGRDIGTAVAPDAAVKIFLVADPATRADRRGREFAGDALDPTTRAATEQALLRRDAADSSRAASPLTQAPDAIVLDSTHLSPDEVVARVLERVAAVAS